MSRALNLFRRLSVDHRDTGWWVAALLTLLVLLNLAGVLVYAQAHPREDGWESLWNYLESDTSKVVSASLIFPLLIFLVEGRFNLLETIRAARSERKRRAQDERREARTKTIDQTIEFWSRVMGWVGEVAFWNGESSLDDFNKEGWKLSVAGGDTINGWARFRNTVEWDGPGSATALETHFLRLVNVLLTCTDSTIAYLEGAPEADREMRQKSLLLIAAGVKRAVHHPLRNILYASRELLDIVESEDPEELRFISSDEQAVQRRKQLETTIDTEIATMADWSDLVKGIVGDSNVLATADGAEADALRASLPDDTGTLRDKYLAIPRDQRYFAWCVPFTEPLLEQFADEFSFQLFLGETEETRALLKARQPSAAGT